MKAPLVSPTSRRCNILVGDAFRSVAHFRGMGESRRPSMVPDRPPSQQLARIAKGEVTLAELAREVAISPSVVRRWHHLSTHGSTAAVGANEDVVPASELRAAQQRT